MARKALIEKEKRRRAMVERHWQKRQELKKMSQNVNVSEEEREEARLKLQKMPKNTSAVRLRNRCRQTGRARGYLRKFQVSRLVFREMAGFGLIPGVTKASW